MMENQGEHHPAWWPAVVSPPPMQTASSLQAACCALQVPSVEDTWAHFDGLLTRLQRVCRLGGITSWRALHAFLRDFASGSPGAAHTAGHMAPIICNLRLGEPVHAGTGSTKSEKHNC